jgi:hypothetical protein
MKAEDQETSDYDAPELELVTAKIKTTVSCQRARERFLAFLRNLFRWCELSRFRVPVLYNVHYHQRQVCQKAFLQRLQDCRLSPVTR